MKRESDKQQKKKNTPILKNKAVVKEVTTNSMVVISRDNIKKKVAKVVGKIKVDRENINREMIGSQIPVRGKMKQQTIKLNLYLQLHIHLRSIPINQRLLLSKLKTRILRSV